jgi:hypothetical protein
MSDKPDGKSWLSMRVLTLAIILAAAYPISATLMAYLNKIRALGDAVEKAIQTSGDRMSILAEWGDGTTNLIFYSAILLTGLAFEIMGFRLVASGFRAPTSTVLFQWGEKKFQITQVVPGVAIAFIGGCLVIAGFYLIHPHALDSGDNREREIREVECTYLSADGRGPEVWVLTVYGNGHGLLQVEWPHSRTVLFMMKPRIRDLLDALARCDVRHLPSEIGQGYMHEESRRIKIRTSTFEKTIEIHTKVDESEEQARCVMGLWRSAVMISQDAQKTR